MMVSLAFDNLIFFREIGNRNSCIFRGIREKNPFNNLKVFKTCYQILVLCWKGYP